MFRLALTAIMTGLGFSACSNEVEEVLTQESEIRLTSEITPSSRVTEEYQSTQFESDRPIGVTITGSKSGNDYVNKLWTADGIGGLSTENKVYWANTNIDLIAYHPYNEEWTQVTTYNFSVKTDQSEAADYLNSDLLFAKNENVTKTENAISLTFSHKLAKINVTLQPEYSEMDLSDAVISICNTKTSTTINLSDGTVPENASGEIKEIKAGVGLTASAIVVPQTVVSGTQFIKVVLGNKTFYYTLPTDKQLKSGYSHNYTLTVKETALEITNSSNINDWNNDEGNTGDANETDVTPYLTFSANEEQTLTMSVAVETLEYSVNGDTWNELGTTTVTFGGNNGDLRLRGRNAGGTAANYTDGSEDYSKIIFGSNNVNVTCEGDIRTLVDYQKYATTSTEEAIFCYLFENCTSLKTAPILPATNLADFCYMRMFKGCTNLISAPELPASTLSRHCYDRMFEDCSSLTTAPRLKAKILTEYCYRWMFSGCSKMNHITMLATDYSANSCLQQYISGVASYGTFVKDKSLPIDMNTIGVIIPTNWDLLDYEE